MEKIEKPSLVSALGLAYIGDGVYELFVREKIINLYPDLPACELHKKSVSYVKAKAQSNSVESLMEMLTEDELAVFKRGRNAKSNTVPKNAELIDYRRATGFEALVGYLYLSGKTERLEVIMECAFNNAF